jgi:cytidylate kinase
MLTEVFFVVVSGPPGSGKTTLATALAPALRLPLIAKDMVKEALMSVLPVPDMETSRILGGATVQAMLALAAESSGAVLQSVWHGSRAQADVRCLPGPVVEVFCRCDRETALRRYATSALDHVMNG